MDLTQNIQAVQQKLAAAAKAAGRDPAGVTLCAATKTQSDAAIRAAIAAGIRVCGENRVHRHTDFLMWRPTTTRSWQRQWRIRSP